MPLRLHKRGRIWHLRGTLAGQRVRESTGLDDKRAAEAYRARREAELIQRRALGPAATRTFADAVIAYVEAGGEARFLGPILEHFGPDKLVADIDLDAVQSAARSLYPDAAPATINRQLITPISAVVSTHYRATGQRPPVFPRRREPPGRVRWLTPDEAERLVDACDARIRPVVLFLLGTGCRTSEAFRLEAPDLHLLTREAWIADPKNGIARMVRFPDRTAEALRALPSEGPVFRTPRGTPYRVTPGRGGQMQAAFNAARDAAGLGPEVTPHVLRHTWATWFYAQTRDFGGLMDCGGWQKADMANRYRKLAPADLGARLQARGWDFRADTKPAQAAGEPVTPASIKVLK
jgi:integrase